MRGSRQNNCWSSKRALKVSAVQRKRRQDRSVKQTGSLLQNRTALSLHHLKPANSSILQSVQSVGTPHQSGPVSVVHWNSPSCMCCQLNPVYAINYLLVTELYMKCIELNMINTKFFLNYTKTTYTLNKPINA